MPSILNLDVLNQFEALVNPKNSKHSKNIPRNFESFEEYRENWGSNFRYEVSSVLLNSKAQEKMEISNTIMQKKNCVPVFVDIKKPDNSSLQKNLS